LNPVAILEQTVEGLDAIHRDAVAALQILQAEARAIAPNEAMLARNCGIGQQT
jgi:hypothetical protein